MDIQNNPGGVENYGFDMDMPKSPWRYPHLMFRTDSRKSKAVSFKQNPGEKIVSPLSITNISRTQYFLDV